MPRLSHFERMILRCSERPDMFEEKFSCPTPLDSSEVSPNFGTSNRNSHANLSSLSSPPLPSSSSMKKRLSGPLSPHMPSSASFISSDRKSLYSTRTRKRSTSSGSSSFETGQEYYPSTNPHSRTTSNIPTNSDEMNVRATPYANALVSNHPPSNEIKSDVSNLLVSSLASNHLVSHALVSNPSSNSTTNPHKRPKDTHFYDTKINYSGKSIPVRIPLQTFPEEVGEVSFFFIDISLNDFFWLIDFESLVFFNPTRSNFFFSKCTKL